MVKFDVFMKSIKLKLVNGTKKSMKLAGKYNLNKDKCMKY